MENFSIEPLKGYGDLAFEMTLDEVVEIIGKPDKQEEIEPVEDGDDSHIVVLDYYNLDLSLYFEGNSVSRLYNFYTVNEKTALYGAKIFDLNKDELIELMAKNGHKNYVEDTDDGDCVTFEDVNIDFYFDENELAEVFWGME
ncbi:MAG: hypothetical protein MJ000_02555 [Bacteroidales bacterium]|nr:hypothetical protein [Bacteroidales bacterium]